MRGLILVLFLTGCSTNPEKVKSLLERDGYTQVEVGGWTVFGCGKDDTFTNEFRAVKSGQQVKGHVCAGWFKGMTIRIDD